MDVTGVVVEKGLVFYPVTPQRLTDTRLATGGRLVAGQVLRVPIAGHGGAPEGDIVKGVSISLIAVGPASHGYLSAYPCETNRPLSSTLNVAAGKNRANLAMVAVSGTTQAVCIYSNIATDVVVDLAGWVSKPPCFVNVPATGLKAGDVNAAEANQQRLETLLRIQRNRIIKFGDTYNPGVCTGGAAAYSGVYLTLKIPAGVFYITKPGTGVPSADFPHYPQSMKQLPLASNKPIPWGSRYIVEGAGMDSTVLRYSIYGTLFGGTAVHHTTLRKMTFEQYTPPTALVGGEQWTYGRKVSQGRVVQVNSGNVHVAIDPGYPAPPSIDQFARGECGVPGNINDKTHIECIGRRYLKRHTRVNRFDPLPKMLVPIYQYPLNKFPRANNFQVFWESSKLVQKNAEVVDSDQSKYRADIYELKTPRFQSLQVGDVVSLKGKHGAMSAFWLHWPKDLVFDQTRWLNNARGVFFKGSYVKWINSEVVKQPPINGIHALMSTSGGGPQFYCGEVVNFNVDPPQRPAVSGTGHLVYNSFFDALGDDAIAFFDAPELNKNGKKELSRVLMNTVWDNHDRSVLYFDQIGKKGGATENAN
jgi:hypothetical protein